MVDGYIRSSSRTGHVPGAMYLDESHGNSARACTRAHVPHAHAYASCTSVTCAYLYVQYRAYPWRLYMYIYVCVYACIYMCVCVCSRLSFNTRRDLSTNSAR